MSFSTRKYWKTKSTWSLYKKYQKYGNYSYDYKLVCADGKFSKSLKSYLADNAVYNFINSMIEEASTVYYNKELVMNKNDDEGF